MYTYDSIILTHTECTEASHLHNPANLMCACPEEILHFICVVDGTGFTYWSGTAFDCSNNGNEILLRHSQYSSGASIASCNAGAITAQGLPNVTNNQYTSLLNVSVATSFNSATIICSHDGDERVVVGTAKLTVITGKIAIKVI